MEMPSPPSTGISDAQAIREVLGGKTDAFAVLVRRHTPFVMHLAARHVPVSACEDIAQEAFIRAYAKLNNFSGKRPFRNWLSGITVNLCMDYWRNSQNRKEASWTALGLEPGVDVERLLAPVATGRFEAEAAARDNEALAQLALGQLSPEDRALLTLTYMREYSTREVAEMLGWSRPKVKVRAFRARKRLRRFLARVLETGGTP